ncbi:major facilitator superfamily transporter [Colletotrichum graminicola]|uniref:Major facilitator superfamily transporter n=1 Tax=Colletotrichum graminicola (strain M1.001 / M2 / FGSC 10212) TaxID=645133 RepID=E3Q3N2_COLGM|nr:major facilitator superfamily transporter [Colletotrichum graminicola M1.001]EFQ25634.1 major facilitator superfamily transporter [Colletotrichum graminicola M1.001]WDK11032.1 major facilitator superfamily transporter [Colletotrichum graminicola]
MTSPSLSERQTGRTSVHTLSEDRTATATPDVNPPKDEKPISSNDDASSSVYGDNDGGNLTPQQSNAPSVWLAETMSFPREVMFIIICCMAQFCTQAAFIDSLFLLHVIGSSFDVDEPARLSWLVAGYSLTIGTFILFSGRLGDAFGYKRMLIIGFAWFSLWSLVAGLSVYSNFTLAVVSRVLQGIGPAICLPNALALFGAAYPPGHRKAMVFSFFGAVAPMGGVVGGAFASVLSLAWWPWALWALSVWLAILAVAGWFIIPEPPTKLPAPDGFKAMIVELDIPGAATGVVSLVLFNFAWNMAPVAGWDTAVVLVPLILGLVLFGAFALIEFKYAPMPLLPFDVVNADVGFVLAAVVCGWATFGVWTLYLVQILQEIRSLPPLLTCAWFAPVVVTGGLAAVITGKLLGPLQVRPPVVMTMALVAFTVGVTLTATAPADQVYWAQIFVSMLVMPFGMDMSFPAATLILSNAVKKEHQGIGASLVNTVVNYGIALGVGFAGTVEVHVNNGGRTKEDQFKGFRGALFMGVGLAGLGLGVALTFLTREWRHRSDGSRNEEKAAEAQTET